MKSPWMPRKFFRLYLTFPVGTKRSGCILLFSFFSRFQRKPWRHSAVDLARGQVTGFAPPPQRSSLCLLRLSLCLCCTSSTRRGFEAEWVAGLIGCLLLARVLIQIASLRGLSRFLSRIRAQVFVRLIGSFASFANIEVTIGAYFKYD